MSPLSRYNIDRNLLSPKEMKIKTAENLRLMKIYKVPLNLETKTRTHKKFLARQKMQYEANKPI